MLRAKAEELKTPSCRLTFTVVNNNVGCRFFHVNEWDRPTNPQPGTVIDGAHLGEYPSFSLIPSPDNASTAKPVHYTVVTCKDLGVGASVERLVPPDHLGKKGRERWMKRKKAEAAELLQQKPEPALADLFNPFSGDFKTFTYHMCFSYPTWTGPCVSP